jgi:hypothetical protein
MDYDNGRVIGEGMIRQARDLHRGAQSAAEVSRVSTQMENLGERLASNLSTLQEINSRLESALDRFSQAPATLAGANTAKEPAPPPSGTLNYLDHLTGRTNEELARLNELVTRVRAIF